MGAAGDPTRPCVVTPGRGRALSGPASGAQQRSPTRSRKDPRVREGPGVASNQVENVDALSSSYITATAAVGANKSETSSTPSERRNPRHAARRDPADTCLADGLMDVVRTGPGPGGPDVRGLAGAEDLVAGSPLDVIRSRRS